MEEIVNFNFADADSGEEVYLSIRAGNNVIALALSIESNGDVEVFMPKDIGKKVVEALTQSLQLSQGPLDEEE